MWTLTRKTKLWERGCCCERSSSSVGRQRALHAHIWSAGWSSGSSGASELLLPFLCVERWSDGPKMGCFECIHHCHSLFDVKQTLGECRPRCEERLTCWLRNSILREFANCGAHICLLSLFGGVKRLENDILSFIKCLYYYIKPAQVL